MATKVRLGVYRIQEAEYEMLPKESLPLMRRHKLRAAALHEVLDNAAGVQVVDWGNTDDKISHEYVELLLTAVGSVALTSLTKAGLRYLGEKFAEHLIDEGTSRLVTWLIGQFSKKAKQKKIADLYISIGNKTSIAVNLPEKGSTVRIRFTGDDDFKSVEIIQE